VGREGCGFCIQDDCSVLSHSLAIKVRDHFFRDGIPFHSVRGGREICGGALNLKELMFLYFLREEIQICWRKGMVTYLLVRTGVRLRILNEARHFQKPGGLGLKVPSKSTI